MHPRQSSRPLPALLSLASILGALAQAVGTILNTSSQRLQAIADLLGAGRAVDGVSDTTAGGADDTADGFAEAACCITNLGFTLVHPQRIWLMEGLAYSGRARLDGALGSGVLVTVERHGCELIWTYPVASKVSLCYS